jgi:type IV fimbrial biogenesis protein FimT
MKKYYEGVTLIELLATLAIIGIVTMIGAPSFNNAVRSTRLATSANELITTLNLARSEAVKRNRRVVVQITGNNWEDGWQVFVDTDGNNVLDGAGDKAACDAGNDCILQVHDALPNSYTLRSNNFPSGIAYTSSGLSSNASCLPAIAPCVAKLYLPTGRFVLCNNTDKDEAGNESTIDGPYSSKLILVNSLGRVRVSSIDANGNGIPEDDSGVELTTCTPP